MAKQRRLLPTKRLAQESAAEAAALAARRDGLMREATSDIVNREKVLMRLRDGAMVTIKDLLVPHPTIHDRLTLRPLAEIPDAIAWAIESVKIHDTLDGQTIEVRLINRTRIMERLGQYLGLWKDGDEHKHLHFHGGESLAGVPASLLEERLRLLNATMAPKGAA